MTNPADFSEARRVLTEAQARVDELAGEMPDPPQPIVDVLNALTESERDELARNKDDAIAEVDVELGPLKASLAELTSRSLAFRQEFESLHVRNDFNRAREIAEWFNSHDDEVGLLKTKIRELESIRAFLTTLHAGPS